MTTNGEKGNGEVSEEKQVVSLDQLHTYLQVETPEAGEVSRPESGKAQNLLTSVGMTSKSDTVLLEDIEKDKLSKTVFKDLRWDNAVKFCNNLPHWNREVACALLRKGAQTFGCWHLDDTDMHGLVNQLMGTDADQISPPLKRWIDMSNQCIDKEGKRLALSMPSKNEAKKGKERQMMSLKTLDDTQVANFMKKRRSEKVRYLSLTEWRNAFVHSSNVKIMKWGLSGLILVIGNGYAIKVVAHMYPGIFKVLGWPVYFARMGGMMIACWTAVLYFTMARGLLTTMVGCGRGKHTAFFDAHKDLHIMAGQALVVTAIEHTVAHCIGTVPGVLYHDLHEINDLFGCANPDDTPGNLGVSLSLFGWPECPITEKPENFTEVLFTTTPGLTGVILLCMIGLLGWTASASRRKHQFEVFWYFHNFLLVVWPILLFLHGSNNWIGVGFPLVIFTSSIPILAYFADRIARLLRFYLYSGTHVKILDAVIRPGKDNGPEGAMTYLRIKKPPHLWLFRPGQYAFICMPEYAYGQWHPFTICSGEFQDTVDFLIAGVGDWTRELAARCLKASQDGTPLPKVGLDGPYAAPTQSALSKDILVSVGAGVGITPFLSLMSTIIQMVDYGRHSSGLRLREAHFFWSTRSADEFLFGRDLFSKIAEDPYLRKRIFVHLHVTAKEAPKDPYSYMFREALKRQSKIDRDHFTDISRRFHETQVIPEGINTPMTWLNGTQQDVMWIGHLTQQYDEIDGKSLLEGCQSSHQNHWGRSFFDSKKYKRAGTMTNLEDSRASDGSAGIRRQISPTRQHMHDWMLPVIFGRPDFGTEVRAIGKAHPTVDVDIYICGNDAIVQNLQEVCLVAHEHAKRDFETGEAKRIQYYEVHYERFG